MIRSGVRDGPVRRAACVALASLLFLSGLTGTLLGQSAQTVVVVPFVNISGQLDDDWLGAGIAETVTTELERVAGLSVAGRRSVLGGEATGLDEQTVRAAGCLRRSLLIRPPLVGRATTRASATRLRTFRRPPQTHTA